MNDTKDLLELTTQLQSEHHSCIRCNNNLSTHRCNECKAFYCSQCKTDHDSHPFLKQHTWKNVGDVSSIVEEKQVYCPIHPGEIMKFNCIDCNVLICVICNGTKHKSHQAESIEEALEKLISMFIGHKEIIDKRIHENEILLTNLKTRSDEIVKECESVETALQQRYDQVVSKAQQDKAKCLQDLQEIRDQQMIIIVRFIKQVERTLQQQRSLRMLNETSLSITQGSSLLQTLQENMVSLTELNAPMTKDYLIASAKFEPNKNQESFIGTVSKMSANPSADFIPRILKPTKRKRRSRKKPTSNTSQ